MCRKAHFNTQIFCDNADMQNGVMINLMNMLFGYTPEKVAQEFCARYGGDVNAIRTAIEHGDKNALADMQKRAKEIAEKNPALVQRVTGIFNHQ
jgi:hypothetical protein